MRSGMNGYAATQQSTIIRALADRDGRFIEL
jgi:hypothetical protein